MDSILIGQALAWLASGLVAFGLLQHDERSLRLLSLLAAAAGVGGAVALVGRVDPGQGLEILLAALGVVAAGAVLGMTIEALRVSGWTIRGRNRAVRRAFGPVPAWAFRRFVSLAKRRTLDEPHRLAREGWAPERLWFVARGPVRVETGTETYEAEGPLFVGEVSILTGAPSPATVMALPGAEVMEWDCSELRRAFRRSPNLRPEIESILARDMARKMAFARPVATQPQSVAFDQEMLDDDVLIRLAG